MLITSGFFSFRRPFLIRHPELVSGSPAIKGDAETSSARRYKKICVICVICDSDKEIAEQARNDDKKNILLKWNDYSLYNKKLNKTINHCF